MAEEETRRYFLLIEFGEGAAAQRLAKVVPKLREAIERMSKNNCLLAYRSPSGAVVGYLIRTALVATQIRARLTVPQEHGMEDPKVLGNHDKVLVLELGKDF